MPNLIHSLLESARQHPNKLAVQDPQRELTFKQLIAVASAIRTIVSRETDCARVPP